MIKYTSYAGVVLVAVILSLFGVWIWSIWPTQIERALSHWERQTRWECYAKYGSVWERDFASPLGTYVNICYGQNSTGMPVEIFRSTFIITYDKDGKETGYTTNNYSIKGDY